MATALIGVVSAASACSSGHDPVAGDTTTAGGSVPVAVASDPPATATTTTDPLFTDPVETADAKDVRTRVDGLAGDGVTPDGFTTIEARITAADGGVCTVCLWLADTAEERSRGLMGVTDLGGAVGMAFLFDAPTDGRFFMFETPAPLSIAWFDASGSFVAATDMDPCLDVDAAACDRYSAGSAYTVAVEMLQGELGVVGIGTGSTIELVSGSESAVCA